MTLDDLADRAQSHPNVMSRVELGDEGITVTNLLYIASALGVTPQELLRGFTQEDLARLPKKSAKRLRPRDRT